MNHDDIEEQRFASHIKCELNAAADQIPDALAKRLSAASALALTHKKHSVAKWASAPRRVLAHATGVDYSGDENITDQNGGFFGSMVGKLGLLWVLLALLAGLLGLGTWEQVRSVDELAEVDLAMLADELPPEAYADHGFSAFLAEQL